MDKIFNVQVFVACKVKTIHGVLGTGPGFVFVFLFCFN